MNAEIAVVIATLNRAEALDKVALPGLQKSRYEQFVAVVWDASEDDLSRKVCEKPWPFAVDYMKAPRKGLTSQRNDAVKHVLKKYPGCRFIVFIDDDCELSPNALRGVAESFSDRDVWGVNIPLETPNEGRVRGGSMLSRLLNNRRRRVVLPVMYNLISREGDRPGEEVEWINGGGMALRTELFRDNDLHFPEEFERFGGYALAEDFALSFHVHRALNKKLINAVDGYVVHHTHEGGRPNIRGMMASRWHNLHLLFDNVYAGLPRWKYLAYRFCFRVPLWIAILRQTYACRSLDAFRGRRDAQAALKLVTKAERLFRGDRS